jgi:hypothetical protein
MPRGNCRIATMASPPQITICRTKLHFVGLKMHFVGLKMHFVGLKMHFVGLEISFMNDKNIYF